MKKIAIYCVSYHSYKALYRYLNSIEKLNKEGISLSVFISDNTDEDYKDILYSPKTYELTVLDHHTNMGYFGGITALMRCYNPDNFDFVIISNVDIEMEENILYTLCNNNYDESVAWIAPKIYSHKERRDRNPKIIKRYSAKKLNILRLLFKYPFLYNLYTHSLYRRKKFINHGKMKIYAGHGSFIILKKKYFDECGIINYPIFLFCEEIYLGEQCCEHKLEVLYDPSLIVYDSEHVSTSNFKTRQYCKYNYNAIGYILKSYYKRELNK